MKHLYLIRGLPGSGKSTFARTLAYGLTGNWNCYVEADMFFINDLGEYQWNPDEIYEAHLWCKTAAREAMERSVDVVVSNTFTTEKELKPYLDMAAEHGYSVTTLIVEGRHGNPSIHDVPEETITKMRNRFSIKL